MNELINQIKRARFIWVIGNGGSASTADHLANDLVKKGYSGIALTNSSLVTMIANDYGYDDIFSKQLHVYGTRDDLLISISCSGTSENIVRGIGRAHIIGMNVYQFEVFNKDRNYGLLEDKHLKFAHEIAKAL